MNVKRLVWIILLLPGLLTAAMAQSAASPGGTNTLSFSHPPQISGGKIITRAGVVYKGVVVQKIEPDGLVIDYAMTDGGMGIAKLKFINLPETLQRQFGYDSTNAAAFEKVERHAEGQWRAQWIADDAQARLKRRQAEISDAEADIEARGGEVGTGFFITDNGYLITCFHVVTNATSIQVGTRQGLFNAELVQSDPDQDIALLKVTGTFSALPLIASNSVNFGEAVFTIGFPNPEAQGWQPKLTRGEISSLSGFQDDTNKYQISVPTQPGNSGGALIDEHGNVVGIVEAKLRASIEEIQANGIVPEDVNYAIKSSCVTTLLDSLPADWPLKLKPEYPPVSRKFGDVVQTSLDAVAVVLVQ